MWEAKTLVQHFHGHPDKTKVYVMKYNTLPEKLAWNHGRWLKNEIKHFERELGHVF